jgi:hypothetical protein
MERFILNVVLKEIFVVYLVSETNLSIIEQIMCHRIKQDCTRNLKTLCDKTLLQIVQRKKDIFLIDTQPFAYFLCRRMP